MLSGAVPEAPRGERFETVGVHPLNNTLLEELVLMSLLLSGPGYALLVEESSKGFDGGVVHRLLNRITTTRRRQFFVTRYGKDKTIGPPYRYGFGSLSRQQSERGARADLAADNLLSTAATYLQLALVRSRWCPRDIAGFRCPPQRLSQPRRSEPWCRSRRGLNEHWVSARKGRPRLERPFSDREHPYPTTYEGLETGYPGVVVSRRK